MSIYQDRRWKRKRKYILMRDEYMCQECKRYGISTTATTVHHIKPLEDYPELWLMDKNLISVCNTCHERYHHRLTGGLTDIGKKLLRRIFGE